MSDSGITLTLPAGSVDMTDLHNLLMKKGVKQAEVDAFLTPDLPVAEPVAEPPVVEPSAQTIETKE